MRRVSPENKYGAPEARSCTAESAIAAWATPSRVGVSVQGNDADGNEWTLGDVSAEEVDQTGLDKPVA